LVALAFGCGAHQRHVAARPTDVANTSEDHRQANLDRAARYPWLDDHSRIRFVDRDKTCPIAHTGALNAGDLTRLVGICLLVQPQLAVGAVVVIGAVVVAVAISEAIEAERRKSPCKCMCMAIDALGKTHGPYSHQTPETKDNSSCNRVCQRDGYAGGGFCR
jgi:hypothetical protein